MAEIKTKANEASVEGFLQTIADETKRKDSFKILELMKLATGSEPKMWGESIIGFGDTHYRYASGREGDWFKIGFSPRKQNLTLYLNYGFDDDKELMQKLGKHKTAKACLYINKLSDVDMGVLQEVVRRVLDRKE